MLTNIQKFRSGEENEQELSYRKHIARKLRTQYVEGIYRLNITP